MEELPFLSHSKSRITLELERTILGLRPEISMSALAKYFDIDWRTVKEVEKKHLKRKYKSIKLKNVKIIGMDEIHIGKEGFKTIVRDLETGAVLHVGVGKGGDALGDFCKRLKHSKAKIEVVAMDMSSAYSKWVKDNFEEARIVFDHFHVIKLMNEKLDKIRRRTVKKLEDKDLKALKKNVSLC
jgi:transposase